MRMNFALVEWVSKHSVMQLHLYFNACRMRMWIVLIRVSIAARISADQTGGQQWRCSSTRHSPLSTLYGRHTSLKIRLTSGTVYCSVEYATHVTASLLSLTGQSKMKSQVRLSRAREFWMAPLYHQRRVTWRRVHWIYMIMLQVCIHDSSPLRIVLLVCTHPPCFILMACWNLMNVFLYTCTLQFHSRFCFKCGHVVPILPITTWVSPSYLLLV